MTIKTPQSATLAAAESDAVASTSINSFDPATGKFRALLYSGAEVRRVSWDGEEFALALTVDGIDLARFQAGASILDSHGTYGGVGAILGRVDLAEVVDGELFIEGRISLRAELEGLRADLAAGIVHYMSIGVDILDAVWTERDGQVPLMTATRTMGKEASFVAIPADPAATMLGDHTMTIKTPAPAAPAPADNVAELAAARAAGAADELARQGKIRQAALALGLADDHAAVALALGDVAVGVEAARDALFAAAADRSRAQPSPVGGLHYGEDRGAALVASLADCVVAGLAEHGGKKIELGAEARTIGPVGLFEAAVKFGEARGRRAPGHGIRDREAAVKFAMTTSDFPIVLANALGKAAREQAIGESPLWADLPGMRRDPADFRLQRRAGLGSISAITDTAQAVTAPSKSLAEEGETFQPTKGMGKITITEETILADDLGEFQRLAMMVQEATIAYENAKLAALFNAPPTMADGLAWFHATHGNLGSGVFALDKVGALITKLRKLTKVGGSVYAGIVPAVLFIPSDLLDTLEALLDASINGATAAAAGSRTVKGLRVVDSPRLTSAAEYYVMGGGSSSGIEYGWVRGRQGAQMTTIAKPEIDGFEVVMKSYFNAGVVNWRGTAKSTGA